MAWTGILLATQGPGLDLGRGEYQPEPDFGVIDADYGAGQRLVEGAYLLAEVVSATDHVSVPGTDRQWIDVKRDLYRGHEHCEAVLVIVEDRMEVGLDLKTETGWQSSVLALYGTPVACGEPRDAERSFSPITLRRNGKRTTSKNRC